MQQDIYRKKKIQMLNMLYKTGFHNMQLQYVRKVLQIRLHHWHYYLKDKLLCNIHAFQIMHMVFTIYH